MTNSKTIKLHIGAKATEFTNIESGKSYQLALGWEQLAEAFLASFPPDYAQVDRAINFTEEVLSEAQHLFDDRFVLESNDEQLQLIASLAFNTTTVDGKIHVPQIELENLFDRFAAIVKGLPSSQDVLPDDNNFAAYLLIVREIMHHLDFRELVYKPAEA